MMEEPKMLKGFSLLEWAKWAKKPPPLINWPKILKKLSPLIQIPLERLTFRAPIKIFPAVMAIHYHDLPKLFDEDVTDSLRRSIWEEISHEK
jgi:hypothetical protein